MANRDIVAIGTSAGGVTALLYLAQHFPADLPASVLVTIHLPSQPRSSLDILMTGAGPLPAAFATHGESLRKGRIYLAPPDRHLLLDGDRLALGSGPREQNSRPAIDPMLNSAALCCGGRTVGVVLTGTLGDGAAGLSAVKRCGGLTVVQNPRSAAFPEMPQTALDRSRPDHIVALEEMPLLLERLVREPSGPTGAGWDTLRLEVDIARGDGGGVGVMDRIGTRSALSCPDCHGQMWEIEDGELTRFRCHVGHSYTDDLMTLALDDSLRRALASAQRALAERLMLARKLHRQATDRGQSHTAQSWATRALEYEQEMAVIRDAIQRMDAMAAQQAVQRMS